MAGQNGVRYHREFFNPVVSPAEHKKLVAEGFGSEKNPSRIVEPVSPARLAHIYHATWAISPYNVTKENFSAWRISFFRQYFQIAILLRHPNITFPGTNRWATTTFNKAIFDSLCAHRTRLESSEVALLDQALAVIDQDDDEFNNMRRAYVGNSMQYFHLLLVGTRFGIPIIRYEELLTKETGALESYLDGRTPFDHRRMAQYLVETRSTEFDTTIPPQLDSVYRVFEAVL
jgi:hypothetical protein